MQSRQEDTTLFVHGAKEQGRIGERENEREAGREGAAERERERERVRESQNTRVGPVN